MPPKLTKEERERLKREEAERKAREEEEERERVEQERREQEEREKEEKEERERLKAIEEARFLEETTKLNIFLHGQRDELDTWKRNQWQRKQWNHYLSCGDLPDPSDEKALNTYLSLYEEDTSDPSIEGTLEGIKECLSLSGEIERLQSGESLPLLQEEEVERLHKTLSHIQALIQSKLDASTRHYLQQAEKHVDSETYNMRVEASSPDLTYCLWGNVVKNPRLKNFTFKERYFVLDIPKPLLLADAAVRVLYLPFDPLSSLSRSYQCKKAPPTPGVDTPSTQSGGGPPGNQANNEGGGESGDGGSVTSGGSGGVRGGSAASKADQPESAENDKPSGSGTDVDPPKQAGQLLPLPHQPLPERKEEGEEEGGQGEDGGRPQTQEGEAGVSVDNGVDGDGGVKCDSGEEEDEVDMRAYRPAGGPILLQLLEMPPPPKMANNWTIRREVARAPKPTGNEEGEQQQAPAPLPGSSLWPAISISMKLPEPFLFSETPQLARWDADLQIWRTNGLKEVTFDLEEKTVSFQTFYFTPLAIMVDLYVNMPYQSWGMVTHGPNHTLLTIVGGMVEVSVEIKETVSTLVRATVEEEETAALSHLINTPMSTRELMQALAKAGANFFPEPDGDKYVSITPKNPLTELSVYHHMALASTTFAFSWSRWNSEASRGKFVIRAAECTSKQSTEQLSWSTYVGGKRSCRLKVTEDSSGFSMELPEGGEMHSNLYSALEGDCSQLARERMRTTSPAHVEAVQHWLTNTKILTYS